MSIVAAKALVRLAVRIRRMRMITNTSNKREKKEKGKINDVSSLSILDVDFKENVDQIHTEHDSIMKWYEKMEAYLLFEMARIAGSGLGLTYIDKENNGENWNKMRTYGYDGKSDVPVSHCAAFLLVSTYAKLKDRGFEEEKGGIEKESDREETIHSENNENTNEGVWLPISNSWNHSSVDIYNNSNTHWDINATVNMSSVVQELWPALVLLSKPFTMRPQRDHNFFRQSSPIHSPFRLALEERTLQDEGLRNTLSVGTGEESPTKKAYLMSSWKGTVKGVPSPPRDYTKNPSTGSSGRTSPMGSPNIRSASRSLETTAEKQGKEHGEDYERKTWIGDWKREKEEKKKMVTAMNLLTGEPLLKPHQTITVTTRIAPSSSYSYTSSDTVYGRGNKGKGETKGQVWGLKEEESYDLGDEDEYSAVAEKEISDVGNKISVFDFSPTVPLKINSLNNSRNNSAETTLTTSESLFVPSFSPSSTSSTPPPLSSTSESVSKSTFLTLNDDTQPTSESVPAVLTSVKSVPENSDGADILDIFDFTTVYSQKEEKRNILLPPSERESLRKIDIRKKVQLESNKSYPPPLFDRTESTVDLFEFGDISGSVNSAKSETGILTEESYKTSTVHTFNKQEIEFTPSVSTAPPTAVATAADLELLFPDKKAIITPTQAPLSKSIRSPPPLPLQPGVKSKGGMGSLGLKPPPTATTTVRRAPSQSLRLQSPVTSSGFGDDFNSNDGGVGSAFSDGIRGPSSSSDLNLKDAGWGSMTVTPPSSSSSSSSFPYTLDSTSTSSFSPSVPAANQFLSQTLPLPAKQNISSFAATSVPLRVGTGTGTGALGFTPSMSGSFVSSSTKDFSPSLPKTDSFSTPFSASQSDPFAPTTSDPFSNSSTFSGDPFGPSTSTSFPSKPVPLPLPLPLSLSVNSPAAMLSPTLANTYPELQYPPPHGAYINPMFNTVGPVSVLGSGTGSGSFALSPAQYHQQTQMQIQMQTRMQHSGTYDPSTQYNSQQTSHASPPFNPNPYPQGFPNTMNIYSQGHPQRSEYVYGVNPAVHALQPPGGQWQQQSGYPLPQTSLNSNNEKPPEIVVVNPFDEFMKK